MHTGFRFRLLPIFATNQQYCISFERIFMRYFYCEHVLHVENVNIEFCQSRSIALKLLPVHKSHGILGSGRRKNCIFTTISTLSQMTKLHRFSVIMMSFLHYYRMCDVFVYDFFMLDVIYAKISCN